MVDVFVSPLLEANSYILPMENLLFVIDAVKGISKFIREHYPEKELVLLLTHAHVDHMYGLAQLNPSKIYIHESDKTLLTNPSLSLGRLYGFDGLDINNLPLAKSEEFSDEWTFFHTPGHSPGSSCFLFKNKYMFTGDTIFPGSIGRTDLLGGDRVEMEKSLIFLKKILVKNQNLQIFPGHGQKTSAKKVLEINPFIKNVRT
ncbi:MAG: MBL fold metallo-hydrolase [Kosmotoga sp.]|nr:MAG: MBL fold metallo-hydrolase [Kosmotoga sp.]